MMIDIGFKNYIDINKIVSLLSPLSANARWLIKEATAANKLINCTHGKKVGTIITLETRHCILSALKSSSIIKKIKTHIDSLENPNLNEELRTEIYS